MCSRMQEGATAEDNELTATKGWEEGTQSTSDGAVPVALSGRSTVRPARPNGESNVNEERVAPNQTQSVAAEVAAVQTLAEPGAEVAVKMA